MSDLFVVPEPSIKAMAAYWEDDTVGDDSHIVSVHEAYKVDFPAAVRAEVERALMAMPHYPPFLDAAYRGAAEGYLAARFPEAAPELEEGDPKPPRRAGLPYRDDTND